MQARFSPGAIWAHLRSTYWFLPALLTAASMGLAVGLTLLDSNMDELVLPTFFYGGGTDGARALLSAVAGSIITVVSVTFSVTIVALTVSSQHFGPRLLNNYMRDTGAQVVLGIFIGTFAYCLLVLRTVQSDGDGYDRFVPQVAVTGAVALALISVSALIYYIHHVAVSMQVATIVQRVTNDLEGAIDRLFPEQLGREAPAEARVPVPTAAAATVPARASGYVQNIEADRVLKLACKHDVVVWLQVRPGDFATAGLPLALAEPAPASGDAFDRELNATLVVGSDRTAQQDAAFPVQQLVEVSLHALSTGINEPYTAVSCLDRLAQGLAVLATRRIPSRVRADESGRVRVVARQFTFPELLDGSLDPIRANAEGSPEVTVHLLKVLARLGRVAKRAEDLAAIARQADLVRESASRWLTDKAYQVALEREYAQVLATLPLPQAEGQA